MSGGGNAQSCDLIVLGAGAAGLMCASVAGQAGLRVVIIEHADAPGKKILISGGGRCNFTNLDCRPERFLSANQHFAKSALRRYPSEDFIALVDAHGIAWHEKTLGQLFCDGSARQIVQMLRDECNEGRVDLRVSARVTDIAHRDGHFHVTYTSPDGPRRLSSPAMVVATGGPSIPKMGASGFAYEVATQFGLTVIPPRPALVPLTLGPDENDFTGLTGISWRTVARAGRTAFAEAALFTHRGLSGPSILQISSYWHAGEAISVDFAPERPRGWLVEAKRATPRQDVVGLLSEHLPARLATLIADRLAGNDGPKPTLSGAPANGDATRKRLADWPDKVLHTWEEKLSQWDFWPTGTEGFAKAEVTAGGVDTSALSSRTMEAKKIPGLYFIGEAVDVTGWLGGYNFQWAWASGQAAGRALGERRAP